MTFEQQKNSKALAWALGVHLALLLFFLLYKYTLPVVTAQEDMGMEINLGTSEDGFGSDQPEIPEDPAAAVSAVTASAASSSNNTDREVETTDNPDAPAVNINRNTSNRNRNPQPVTHTNRSRSNTQSASTVSANRPAQSPRYVYPGATGAGGNRAQGNQPGSNEGIGQGEGDMGVPGGTPGASNYSGVPGGGGSTMISSIQGRTLVGRPDPKAEFREGGRVVIRVTVNREGTVTDYRVLSAANATIRALALKKLQAVRFNKSTTAPAEQFGNITFDFRTTRR